MPNLIHPTLFIFARLGLFLALLAWIVGQWWTVEFHFKLRFFTAQDYGYSVGAWKRAFLTAPATFEVHRSDWMRDFWPLRREIRLGDREWQSIIPGIVRAGGGSGRDQMSFFVGVRHWLVVTVFALFNGVLMWVYRKRGKEPAVDE